jgi:hypothetical protein
MNTTVFALLNTTSGRPKNLGCLLCEETLLAFELAGFLER